MQRLQIPPFCMCGVTLIFINKLVVKQSRLIAYKVSKLNLNFKNPLNQYASFRKEMMEGGNSN